MTTLSTSDNILACAHSLIIAGGYNGFSYADIADKVGIRKPSIHHHFPSKVDLVRTLVARYREQAEAGVAELERRIRDPVELLRNCLGYWETCIMDASASFCICALMASEIPVLPDLVVFEIRAHFRFLSGWLCSVFERGVEQGRFALVSTPAAEAEAFLATLHGAMLSARAYNDPNVFGLITAPLLDRLMVRQ